MYLGKHAHRGGVDKTLVAENLGREVGKGGDLRGLN